MPWRKTSLVLVLLLAWAVVLASCGGRTQSSTQSTSTLGVKVGKPSGVIGIVLFEGGPAIPSPSPPLPGGFGSGSLGRPYRFVVVQVKATSGPRAGEVVARVKPDSRALFRIDLPPGRYLLMPLVPKHGPWPRPTTVTVRAGQRTRAIVRVEGM